MRVLAIETSCDDTSIALVEIGRQHPIPSDQNKTALPRVKVLKSVVSSQIKIHAPFGGVVPSLAKREHIKNLPIIWKEFLKHPAIKNKKVDLLTVTVGPGLEPALWTGITFAKEIHKEYFQEKIPLVGANHLEGHLYSFLLSRKISDFGLSTSNKRRVFPAVALIVSGGHTILGILENISIFKKLGETKDDAVGECFDKVARLLQLPYPGGPEIERLAKEGDENAIPFPSPMLYQKNYDFSYSGLKTSVLYYLRDGGKARKEDIAASFQSAAFKVLAKKAARAAEAHKATSVIIGGGVAASKALRNILRKETRMPLVVPPFKYCMDNAVMVAIAGYFSYLQKKKYKLEANGNLNI